jgi:hypothetical protein
MDEVLELPVGVGAVRSAEVRVDLDVDDAQIARRASQLKNGDATGNDFRDVIREVCNQSISNQSVTQSVHIAELFQDDEESDATRIGRSSHMAIIQAEVFAVTRMRFLDQHDIVAGQKPACASWINTTSWPGKRERT